MITFFTEYGLESQSDQGVKLNHVFTKYVMPDKQCSLVVADNCFDVKWE